MKIERRPECAFTPASLLHYAERELKKNLPRWQERLSKEPLAFGVIEKETLDWGRKLAGLMLATVLASKKVQQAVDARAEVIRKQAHLKQNYRKPRKVVLLSGLVLKIRSLYCSPRPSRKKRGAPGRIRRRGTDPVGLYPEWAALGIREGASPQLQSEVARQVVLLSSFDAARKEMKRRGVKLNVKTVWRVSMEVGHQGLAARSDKLKQWRAGSSTAGNELAGKRIAVATDGGRARTREPRKRGRKTKKGRDRYKTNWREPKLMTIYVLDEYGKLDRNNLVMVDGTMQGPDHMAELIAFHLHRLGAAKAKSVTFTGDGAPWIWNRADRIMEVAGIDPKRVSKVVDISHVVSQIARALEACAGMNKKERKKQQTRLKRRLLAGEVDEVLSYLKKLSRGRRAGIIGKVMRYIEKRRDLMLYDELLSKNLPIGSGAIESAIRRVINLRIKAPGSFWYVDNIEAMMYMRAQELTGRWDEMMENVLEHSRRTRNLAWKWEANPYSKNKLDETEDVAISGGYVDAA